jgi:hypothetical protein
MYDRAQLIAAQHFQLCDPCNCISLMIQTYSHLMFAALQFLYTPTTRCTSTVWVAFITSKHCLRNKHLHTHMWFSSNAMLTNHWLASYTPHFTINMLPGYQGIIARHHGVLPDLEADITEPINDAEVEASEYVRGIWRLDWARSVSVCVHACFIQRSWLCILLWYHLVFRCNWIYTWSTGMYDSFVAGLIFSLRWATALFGRTSVAIATSTLISGGGLASNWNHRWYCMALRLWSLGRWGSLCRRYQAGLCVSTVGYMPPIMMLCIKVFILYIDRQMNIGDMAYRSITL